MILSIDIGNSQIVIGAYPLDWSQNQPPVAHWRLATERQRTGDEYRLLLRQLWQEQGLTPGDFSHGALCSVVAPLTDVWRRMVGSLLACDPLVIDATLDLGMDLDVARPEGVGTDRLVDAVAARRRLGSPCIVVDFGTATTFNVIDQVNGRPCFVGGAIAPGLGTVTGALTERANALPAVELVAPARAIGKDTIPAIQSGLVYGYVGLVEGLLARIRAEVGADTPVIATGGLGHVIAPLTTSIDSYDPWLTLAGIVEIYRLNRS